MVSFLNSRATNRNFLFFIFAVFTFFFFIRGKIRLWEWQSEEQSKMKCPVPRGLPGLLHKGFGRQIFLTGWLMLPGAWSQSWRPDHFASQPHLVESPLCPWGQVQKAGDLNLWTALWLLSPGSRFSSAWAISPLFIFQRRQTLHYPETGGQRALDPIWRPHGKNSCWNNKNIWKKKWRKQRKWYQDCR